MTEAEPPSPLDSSVRPLPNPVVPADLYDEAYYRTACAGYAEWTESDGVEVAGLYPGILAMAGLKPGDVLVDIGTGRGEMLAVAVEHGAARAIGIEYSPAAVEMARKTLGAHGTNDAAEVLLVDARSIPLPDDSADLVTMVDVVEHLAPEELDLTLAEAFRILKPGGQLFAHTMPNRNIYDVTYRLQRLMTPGRRRHWPADPRKDNEKQMHVNEQTLKGLRRTLCQAGFRPVRTWLGEWIYAEFVPDERARRLYKILAKIPMTARFGVGDLFARAIKP